MVFATRMKRKISRCLRRAPRGGNGIYIQLSKKRGIKILRYEYESYEEIIRYNSHIKVYEEARAMKMAKRLYPYIPECYGVKLFKINGFYTIGILLQHLGDVRIGDIMDDPCDTCLELERELYELGIQHNDVHSHNVMYFKQKYWVIDFGCVKINNQTIKIK